ncbi:MAG: DUF3365 domain-containing protein [Methylococcales bacterium]
MKKQLLMLSLSALLAACGGEDKQAQAPGHTNSTNGQTKTSANFDKAALTEKAKTAVQTLGATLKSELEVAMKAGGPLNALSICNTKALEIASKVSLGQGLQVSRVSLKNRNPGNAANDWQIKVLNDFETRKVAGEDPTTLSYTEMVGDEFRFMKAIPTGNVCLGCHGTNISPAVTAKLAELYPLDKATGYKEGDLRGAFVAVKNFAL